MSVDRETFRAKVALPRVTEPGDRAPTVEEIERMLVHADADKGEEGERHRSSWIEEHALVQGKECGVQVWPMVEATQTSTVKAIASKHLAASLGTTNLISVCDVLLTWCEIWVTKSVKSVTGVMNMEIDGLVWLGLPLICMVVAVLLRGSLPKRSGRSPRWTAFSILVAVTIVTLYTILRGA